VCGYNDDRRRFHKPPAEFPEGIDGFMFDDGDVRCAVGQEQGRVAMGHVQKLFI
jgi:hypothetical protein